MPAFTLYLDESGDHGLIPVNREYPVLALCGVAVENAYYAEALLPRINAFKVQHFGHAGIALHYRALAQHAGPFRHLADQETAWEFENELAGLLRELDITVICAVIRKNEYLQRYGPTRPVDQFLPNNLYLMALDSVLERAVKFLEEQAEASSLVVAEARGKREDALVGAEYRELLPRGTQFVSAERFQRSLGPDPAFSTKKDRVAGLELADITAAPIATQVLRPESPSPLWDAIRSKIWVGKGARGLGNVGLKSFPRDSILDPLFKSLRE